MTWLRKETDPEGNTGGGWGAGGGYQDTRKHLSHTIWGEDGNKEQEWAQQWFVPHP